MCQIDVKGKLPLYMLFEQKSRRGTDGVLFFWALPFFHLQYWRFFLFLKGVARQGRALEGQGCNWECLYSQRHPCHFSNRCSAPTFQ